MLVCLSKEMESARVAVLLSVVVGALLLVLPCRATQYTVGGTSGWDISSNFNTWLSGKTFHVGDTLVFTYSSMHSLMEVSKADYNSCTSGNALKSYTDGNTQIGLKSVGTKYFICGTPGHCLGGMKIAIPVKAAASGSPTASSPAAGKSPSSSTPSTPAGSTPSTKSPSTDASAAVSISNVGVLLGGGFAALVAGFVLL